MSRTVEIKPGDILVGKVMKFHLEYRTSLDGGTNRIDMVADVDCEGISIEEVKELMAGQGLIVKSQNNRERKLADLRKDRHFKGGWKEFTKSSGRRMDVSSMKATDIYSMLTPEQKAEMVRMMNQDVKNGATFTEAANNASKRVAEMNQ